VSLGLGRYSISSRDNLSNKMILVLNVFLSLKVSLFLELCNHYNVITEQRNKRLLILVTPESIKNFMRLHGINNLRLLHATPTTTQSVIYLEVNL
jgi:hypothetical protein